MPDPYEDILNIASGKAPRPRRDYDPDTALNLISKYESGERRLDILEIRELCQVIGIDFVAFMRRIDKDLKSES